MSALEVRDLKKAFVAPDGGALTVVDVPAFALAEGEQVCLMGRSGSGKTTFLHLVAGILQADSGTVRVGGEEMTGRSEAARDRLRARALGYVFQSFHLLQGYTALENVLLGMMFGPGPDEARARELLERVGLADRTSYRPRQLSVGQQQRVALARALANRPRLILADEPTGSLDAGHAGAAIELVREACAESGAALLLVTHDRDLMARFERVEELDALNRAAAAHVRGSGA